MSLTASAAQVAHRIPPKMPSSRDTQDMEHLAGQLPDCRTRDYKRSTQLLHEDLTSVRQRQEALLAESRAARAENIADHRATRDALQSMTLARFEEIRTAVAAEHSQTRSDVLRVGVALREHAVAVAQSSAKQYDMIKQAVSASLQEHQQQQGETVDILVCAVCLKN